MANENYVDCGNDDGVVLGQYTSTKLGFYGLTTPVDQETIAAVTMATTTLTSALADLLAIKAVLVNIGLVTSG